MEFGPQFLVEPTISLNYFDTPYGTGDSHLVSARITYTLTPRMFVSALLQYTSATEQASTNARFRWEYQPGSELFVVYTDGAHHRRGRLPAAAAEPQPRRQGDEAVPLV